MFLPLPRWRASCWLTPPRPGRLPESRADQRPIRRMLCGRPWPAVASDNASCRSGEKTFLIISQGTTQLCVRSRAGLAIPGWSKGFRDKVSAWGRAFSAFLLLRDAGWINSPSSTATHTPGAQNLRCRDREVAETRRLGLSPSRCWLLTLFRNGQQRRRQPCR